LISIAETRLLMVRALLSTVSGRNGAENGTAAFDPVRARLFERNCARLGAECRMPLAAFYAFGNDSEHVQTPKR
jgi:predicted GNAT superfamily acetyltransferase